MGNFRLILKGKESGFTMTEVLIVIAIIGILAMAAIPGFSAWLPSYRLKSASQDLLSNFQLAKLTAVKQNKYCAVRFTAGQYTVFVDKDKNRQYDTGESVLTTRRWEDYKDVPAADVNPVFSDGQDNLCFRSNGLPINNGTVTLKNTKGKTLSVVVSIAGNVKIQ